MTSIEQALNAMAQYDAEIRAGGEPAYPQWAADLLQARENIKPVFVEGANTPSRGMYHNADTSGDPTAQPSAEHESFYSMPSEVRIPQTFNGLLECLKSPEFVHRNMLAGHIAKIDMSVCAHTHGSDMVDLWNAAQPRVDLTDEQITKAWEATMEKHVIVDLDVAKEFAHLLANTAQGEHQDSERIDFIQDWVVVQFPDGTTGQSIREMVDSARKVIDAQIAESKDD